MDQGKGASKVGAAGAERKAQRRARGIDLLVCAGLVALAGLAYATLPGGSVLRVALGVLVLLFVPGYLLIEAAAGPARTAASRARRSLLAIGVSPAIVGLLALATAGLPGGFRPFPIVILLVVTCVALAAAALWRRKVHSQTTLAEPTLA